MRGERGEKREKERNWEGGIMRGETGEKREKEKKWQGGIMREWNKTT